MLCLLVKELNSMNQGVKVGLRVKRLGTLLYADDIVLLAEDARSLQRMLDTVTNYVRKWRFELNPKKSQVVVFTKKQPSNCEVEAGRKCDSTSDTSRDRTDENSSLECLCEKNILKHNGI